MRTRPFLVLSVASWAALAITCSSDPSGSGAGDGDAASPTGDQDASTTSPRDGAVPEGGGGRDGGVDAAVKGALFAFVGSSDGTIHTYAVDAAAGTFSLEKTSSAGQNPSFLAFDPARRRVVAVDEITSGMVRSFAFDPDARTLNELSTQPSGGAAPTHLSFDPRGKWVTVANYTAGSMSIFPIDGAGALGAASDARTTGASSHWAGTNPSGTHVFVSSLGANVIAQFTLDAVTGKLADNGTASLPAGSGPRHVAFHPSEKWAYVVSELATTVTTFDFDKTTGKLSAKQTLSALPPGQSAAAATGAEIFVHPSGKHVYASTRGFNSIARFSVNASDGTLTLVANAPTGGDQPRSFGLDPEGTLLFAGNQAQGQVVGFRIDPASGALTSLGKTVDVTGPTFVGLARMP